MMRTGSTGSTSGTLRLGSAPHAGVRGTLPVLLAAILIGAAAPDAEAQRPIDVPSSAYAARRASLFTATGGAPVVAFGEYMIRSGGEGRQDPNFWYLTGVESPYAILVIRPDGSPDGQSVLFLPEEFQFAGAQYPMVDERFRHARWNRTILRASPGAETARRLGVDLTFPVDEFATRLPSLLAGASVVHALRDTGRLYAPPGIAAPRSYRQQLEDGLLRLLPGIELTDATPLVERMRVIKDEHEIQALRRSASISSEGFLDAMRAIAPGKNDLEIAGVMEAAWKRGGSSRAAFSPIVVSGEAAVSLYTLRSEVYNSTDRVMADGEMIFIDYGAAEYDMYTSDICRTFPVSGRFTDLQRQRYSVVLEALEAAVAEVRPGVMMVDVIRAAAAVFKKHGYDEYEDIDRMGAERVWGLMPSPTYWIDQRGGLTDYSGARGTGVRDLGHHVGLEALDSRDYTTPLEPGMVFTIEPKIYVPEEGLAIMIEDMILVTEDGYENLSESAPKSIEEIEAVMQGRR